MTPPAAGIPAGPPAVPLLAAGPVYRATDAGRVEILIDAADTGGVFDLIEVHLEPGGNWAAHRHAFAEWFRVLEGELELLTPRGGRLCPLACVTAGQTGFVPPWAPHAVRSTASSTARFLVTGQPGVMSRYFARSAAPAGGPHPQAGPRALAHSPPATTSN